MFQNNHKTYFKLSLFFGIVELVRFYYANYSFFHFYHHPDDSVSEDLLTILLPIISSVILLLPLLIIGAIEFYFFKKYPKNRMRLHKLHRIGTIIPISLIFFIVLVSPFIFIPRRYYSFNNGNNSSSNIITELYNFTIHHLNAIATISALIFLFIQIIPIYHLYLCKKSKSS